MAPGKTTRDFDVWAVDKTASGWSEPRNLGAPVNSSVNEYFASEASDGTLYVSWANFNTTNSGKDNHFQVLLARSTDGGKTFSTPIKAADYYELPDCDTYQGEGKDPGRACVPEKGTATNSVFRATNYPNVVVDPANPKHVVVTTGSYINADSNEGGGCTPE